MTSRLCLAALLILALATGAFAGVDKRLQFKPGASSGAVSGTVVRGDRDVWRVGAGKGQDMTVQITSLEDNAVFQIYAPGGKALPGADEGQDATTWRGRLPAKGDYRIVVGGTRGNCSYRLTVTIR